MKLTKAVSLFVTIMLLAKTVSAQGKYEWKETTADGYKYKYVTGDPMQTRFYTLKNGMTVILSQDSKEPRMHVYEGRQ
jgi:hypothetical protein